jgi:photosystem II stability/assembly factor-like uncharacterized protein
MNKNPRARVFLANGASTGSISRAERIDDGTWQIEYLLNGFGVSCFAVDPRSPDVIYAGTRTMGVLRSEDRGITWLEIGLKEIPIKSLAVSPHDSQIIVAGGLPAQLTITQDQGATWERLDGFQKIPNRWWWFSPADPSLKAYVQAISFSPKDPKIILAGIELGAVVRSEDGGSTWSRHLRGSLRDCHSLTFHPVNGDWAYEAGGSGGGVSLSQDGGRTWHKHRSGLDRTYGWACAADPHQPNIWYASISTGPGKAHSFGNAQAYIFRSMDGSAWEKLSGGLPTPLSHMPYELLTDNEAPGHLYAGMSNGEVWHTHDHGDTWNKLPFKLGGIHRSMVMLY